MKALFEYYDSSPFMITCGHYEDLFPVHTFPHCGNFETGMIRYIPVDVIIAIYEKHGFLKEPHKYENRLGSMDAIMGTFRSVYNMPRAWNYPWNAWRHFSITEEQAKEDIRKAALRFNFTTLCPCKVDRNRVTDRWNCICLP